MKSKYKFDKSKHYFCQMDFISYVIPFMGIAMSDGSKNWVECKIVEDEYKVADGYKVTLEPLDKRYARHHFYQSDFESLLQKGYIIEKTSDKQHVAFCKWYEPITLTVCVEHSGFIVANE